MARRLARWPLALGIPLVLACGGRTLDVSPWSSANGGTTSASGSASVGGSSSSGGDLGAGGRCTELVELVALPPVVEFLTDTSLSMGRALEGSTLPRWQLVRDALATAFNRMPSEHWAGIACFPNIQLSAGSPVCYLPTDTLPIAELSPAQRRRAVSVLEAKQLFGATPTEDAYAYALDRIEQTGKRGSRYVVLTTDGPPTYARNCAGDGLTKVDTIPLIQAAKRAREDGVRTFVIGVGDALESAWMSDLALAGGTAPAGCVPTPSRFCHHQLHGETDPDLAIEAAYAHVLREALGCVFVPREPGQVLRTANPATRLAWTDGIDQVAFVDPGCATVDARTGRVEICDELCSRATHDRLRLMIEQACR